MKPEMVRQPLNLSVSPLAESLFNCWKVTTAKDIRGPENDRDRDKGPHVKTLKTELTPS